MAKKKRKFNSGNAFKNYVKNLGKSAADLGADILFDNEFGLTSVQEMIRDNSELAEQGINAYKNRENIFKMIKETVDKQVFAQAKELKKNVLSDIKSGKIYNKSREDDAFMKSFGMDDMLGDDFFDGMDDFADDIKSGVGNSLNDFADDLSSNFSETMSDFSADIVKSNNKSTLAGINADIKMHKQSMEGMSVVNSSIGALASFNESRVSPFLDRAMEYYDKSIEQREKTNQLLEQMASLQQQIIDDDDRTDAEKAFGFNYSSFNIKEYTKAVTQSTINVISEITGMDVGDFGGTFGGGNMIKAIIANPLGTAVHAGLVKVIPQAFKEATKELNKSISSFFPSLMLKLNDIADKNFGTLKGTIARIFGIDMNKSASVNLGGYEKGKVAFDGITKKTIVDVIPTYLRKILSAITKQDEIVFDRTTGKFTTLSKAKEAADDITNTSFMDYSSSKDKIKGHISSQGNLSAQQMEQFESLVDNVFDSISKNVNGLINRDIDFTKIKGLDISKAEAEMMSRAFQAFSKADFLQLQKEHASAKKARATNIKDFNKNMEQNLALQYFLTSDLGKEELRTSSKPRTKMSNAVARATNFQSGLSISDAGQKANARRRAYEEAKKSNPKLTEAEFAKSYDGNEGLRDELKGKIPGLEKFDENTKSFLSNVQKIISKPFNFLEKQFQKFDGFLYDVIFDSELSKNIKQKVSNFFNDFKTKVFGKKDSSGQWDKVGLLSSTFDVFRDYGNAFANSIWGKGYIDRNGNPIQAKEKPLFGAIKTKFFELTDKAKGFLFSKKDEDGNLLSQGFLSKTKDKMLDLVERTKLYLFGEKDEDGNVIDGKAGVIPQKYQEMFKKYAPHAAAGAGIGAVASIFLPFGGMVGTLGGAVAATVLEMDKVKDWLWGPENDEGKRENGILTKTKNKLYEKISKLDKYLFGENEEGKLGKLGMTRQKFGMGTGIGAGLGLLGSFILPGGSVLGTLMGAAAGFASQTERFQKFLFGDDNAAAGSWKKDGLIPTTKEYLTEKVLNPIRDYTVGTFRYVKDFVNAKMVVPFNLAFKPIAVEAGLQIKKTFKNITQFTQNLWHGFMDSMSEKMDDLFGTASKRFILAPLGEYFKDKLENIGSMVSSGLKKPMQKIQDYASRLRIKHIAEGNDGYMKGTKYGALVDDWQNRNVNDNWNNRVKMKGSHQDYINQAREERIKKHEEWLAKNGGFNPFSKDYKLPKRKKGEELSGDDLGNTAIIAAMSDKQIGEGITRETELRAENEISNKRQLRLGYFKGISKGNASAVRDISRDASATRTEKISAFISEKVSSIGSTLSGIFEHTKMIARGVGKSSLGMSDEALKKFNDETDLRIQNLTDEDQAIDTAGIYEKNKKAISKAMEKKNFRARKTLSEAGYSEDQIQDLAIKQRNKNYLDATRESKIAGARKAYQEAIAAGDLKKAESIESSTKKKYGDGITLGDAHNTLPVAKSAVNGAISDANQTKAELSKGGLDSSEQKELAVREAELEQKKEDSENIAKTAENTSLFKQVFEKGKGWLWGFASKAIKWGALILPLLAVGKKLYDLVKNWNSSGSSVVADAAGNLHDIVNSNASRIAEFGYDAAKIAINPLVSPKLNKKFAQGTVKTIGATADHLKQFMGKSPFVDALKTSFNPASYTKTGRALGGSFMDDVIKGFSGGLADDAIAGYADDIVSRQLGEKLGDTALNAYATKQSSKLASQLTLKNKAIKAAGGELSEAALAKYSPNWFAKSLNKIANSNLMNKYLGNTKLGNKVISEISQTAANSAAKAMAKEGTERVGMQLATKLAGPLVNGALFGVDMARGYAETNRIFNLPEDYEPTFGMKASAAVGKGISELLLGLVNPGWIAERVYNVVGSNEDKQELIKQQEALALQAGVSLEALYSDDAEISKAAKAQLKAYSETVNKTAFTKLGEWSKTDGAKTMGTIAKAVANWKIPGVSGAVSFAVGAADGKSAREDLGLLADASLGVTGRIAGGFAKQLETLTFGVFKYSNTIHGIHGITLLIKDGLVKVKDGIVNVLKWFGNLPENLANLVENWETAISGALSGTRFEALTQPIVSAINGIKNIFTFAYESLEYVFGGFAKMLGLDNLWNKAKARSAQEVSKNNLEALKNRMSTDVTLGSNKLSGFDMNTALGQANNLDDAQKANLMNYASQYTEGVDVISANSLDASYGLTAETIKSVVSTSKSYNEANGITDNSTINVDSLASDQVQTAYAIEAERAKMYEAIAQGDSGKVQELAGSDVGKLLMENDEAYKKLVDSSAAMLGSMNGEKDPMSLGEKIGKGVVGGVLALPIAKMFLPIGKSLMSSFKLLLSPINIILKTFGIGKKVNAKIDKSPLGQVKSAFIGPDGVVDTMKNVLENTGEALINKIAKIQGYEAGGLTGNYKSSQAQVKDQINTNLKNSQKARSSHGTKSAAELAGLRGSSAVSGYKSGELMADIQKAEYAKELAEAAGDSKKAEAISKSIEKKRKELAKETQNLDQTMSNATDRVKKEIKDLEDQSYKAAQDTDKKMDKSRKVLKTSVTNVGKEAVKASEEASQDVEKSKKNIFQRVKEYGSGLFKKSKDASNDIEKSSNTVQNATKNHGKKVKTTSQQASVQIDNAGDKVSKEIVEMGTDIASSSNTSANLINSAGNASGTSAVAKAGIFSKIGSGIKKLASTKGGKAGLIIGGIAIVGGITASIINKKKKASDTKMSDLTAEEKEAAKRLLNSLNSGEVTMSDLNDAEIALLQAYQSAKSKSAQSTIGKVANVASTGALGYTASGIADAYTSAVGEDEELAQLNEYLSQEEISETTSSSGIGSTLLTVGTSAVPMLMMGTTGDKIKDGAKKLFGKVTGKAGSKAAKEVGKKAAKKAATKAATKTAGKGLFSKIGGMFAKKGATKAATSAVAKGATSVAAKAGAGGILKGALGVASKAAPWAALAYAGYKGIKGAVQANDTFGVGDDFETTGGMRAASAVTNLIPFLSDEKKSKVSTWLYSTFGGDKKNVEKIKAAQAGYSNYEADAYANQLDQIEKEQEKNTFELQAKIQEVMGSRTTSSMNDLSELEKQKEVDQETRDMLIDITKGTLNEGVSTAWVTANQNALKKWKQALGVDVGFNVMKGIKSGITSFAEGMTGKARTGFGLFGGVVNLGKTIWNAFDKATTVDDTAAKSVETLTNKTMTSWTTAFENSLPLYDEINTSDFMNEADENGAVLSENLKKIAKTGLREGIATGWLATNENAAKKWKQALGVDTGFNIMRGLKVGISAFAEGMTGKARTGFGLFGGVVNLGKTIWNAFDKATTVDDTAAKSVEQLTNKTMSKWTSMFAESLPIYDELGGNVIFDEVDTDDGVSLRENLKYIAKKGIREGLVTGWLTANENAASKFKQALGVDTKFNVMSGLKTGIKAFAEGTVGKAGTGFGLFGGIVNLGKTIFKKLDEATTVDDSVAEIVGTLTNKTLEEWKKRFKESTGLFDEIADIDLMNDSSEDGISVGSALKELSLNKMKEGLTLAWGVSNDQAAKQFKKALGIDGMSKTLDVLRTIGTLGLNKVFEHNVDNLENMTNGVKSTVENLSDKIMAAWVTKFRYVAGWTEYDVDFEKSTEGSWLKRLIPKVSIKKTEHEGWVKKLILDDDSFLSGSQDEVKDLTKNAMIDTLKLLWGTANDDAQKQFKTALGLDPMSKVGNILTTVGTLGLNKVFEHNKTLLDSVKNGIYGVVANISEQIMNAWVDKFKWVAGWTETNVSFQKGEGTGLKSLFTGKFNVSQTKHEGWVKKLIIDDDSFLTESQDDVKEIARTAMMDTVKLLWSESNKISKEGFRESIQNVTQSEWWDKLGNFLGIGGRNELMHSIADKVTPIVSGTTDQLLNAWQYKFMKVMGYSGDFESAFNSGTTNLIDDWMSNVVLKDGWVHRFIINDDSFLSETHGDVTNTAKTAMVDVVKTLWSEGNDIAKNGFHEAIDNTTQSEWWDKVADWLGFGNRQELTDNIANKVTPIVSGTTDQLLNAWQYKFMKVMGYSGEYSDTFDGTSIKVDEWATKHVDLNASWVKKFIIDDENFLSNTHSGVTQTAKSAMTEVLTKMWQTSNDVSKKGFLLALEDKTDTNVKGGSSWWERVCKWWAKATGNNEGNAEETYTNEIRNKVEPIVGGITDNIRDAWIDKFKWVAGGTEVTEYRREGDIVKSYGEGWVKTLITNDDSFLSKAQEPVKNILKTGMSETVSSIVKLGSTINKRAWAKAMMSIYQKYNISDSAYTDAFMMGTDTNLFGITANDANNMNPEDPTVQSVDNMVKAISKLWASHLNGMANVISQGTISSDMFSGEDTNKLFDSLKKETDALSSFNSEISSNLSDYSSFSSLFSNGDFGGEFAGFKKFIYYTKRMSIMVPVMTKNISSDLDGTFNNVDADIKSVGTALENSISQAKSSINNVSKSSSASNFFNNKPSTSDTMFGGLKTAAYYMGKLFLFPVYMIKSLSKRLEGEYNNISVSWANVSTTGGMGGYGSENKLNDPSLASKSYAGSTLAQAGCGPIAASRALGNLGINASIKQIADYNTSKGYADRNLGTDSKFIYGLAKDTGASVNSINGGDQKSLDIALANGQTVIANGSNFRNVNMPYTSRGHYLNIYGKSGDKYLVENTNGTSGLYSWSQIGHMSGTDPNTDWEGAREFYALSNNGKMTSSGKSYFGGDTEYTKSELAIANVMKSMEKKLAYTQSAKRTNIPSGWGDCSSTVAWVYKNLFGIDVGSWTGAQEDTGTIVARNNNVDKLRPGDLLQYSGHVEMVTGPNGEMMGHGGGSDGTKKGPQFHNVNTYYKKYKTAHRYDIANKSFNPLNISAKDWQGNSYTITSGDVSAGSSSSSGSTSSESSTSSGRRLANFISSLGSSTSEISKTYLKENFGVEDINTLLTSASNVFLDIADPEVAGSTSSESSSTSTSNVSSSGVDASAFKALTSSTYKNTDLYQVAKPSENQIKDILLNRFAIKGNSIFTNSNSASSASGIYKAQQETGVSALIPLGIGAWESGWGTSKIARDKGNLWGWAAYNASPYASATSFGSNTYDSFKGYTDKLIGTYYNNYGAKSIHAIGTGDNPAGKGYAYHDNGTINKKWADNVTSVAMMMVNSAGGTGGFGGNIKGKGIPVHLQKFTGFGPSAVASSTPTVRMNDYRTEISDDINKTLSAIKVANESGGNVTTSYIDTIIAYLKAIEENTRNTSSNTAASNKNENSIITALEEILNLKSTGGVNVVAVGGDNTSTNNQLHTKDVSNIFTNHGIQDENEAQKVNDKLRKIADLIAKGK